MIKDKKLEQEIEEIIAKSPIKSDPRHSKSTRKWVLKLKPDADYALQIAALAHDIDRGFEPDYFVKHKDKFKNYTANRLDHCEQCSKIIQKLLIKYDFDKKFINKVAHLVLNHESGGDKESEILKDADSISFFEGNIPIYLRDNGLKNTKLKIEFMFSRMSEKAKNIVKKFKYKNPELNSIFRELYHIATVRSKVYNETGN